MGCQVRLIGPYDSAIDDGTTALQKQTERMLLSIQRKIAQDPSATLMPGAQESIDEILVDMAVLKSRAESTKKNDITVKQFVILESSMSKLQKLIEMHDKAVADGNSNNRLNADILALTRKDMRQSYQQVIALEIAKKRGTQD